MTDKEVEEPTIAANQSLLLRNNFYRDNYRRIMLLTIVLVVIILGQIALIFFLHATRTKPSYYATTYGGNQIALTPRDQPNLSTEALLDWVKTAATTSYSLNFVDWSDALNNIKSFYTPSGYESFMAALQSSGTLADIREKKLVVSAVVTGTPVILKEGPINENYSWQVQLPVLLSYQSSSEVIKQNITMTMLVTRLSTLESEKGIGIAQLIVQERSGTTAQ